MAESTLNLKTQTEEIIIVNPDEFSAVKLQVTETIAGYCYSDKTNKMGWQQKLPQLNQSNSGYINQFSCVITLTLLV